MSQKKVKTPEKKKKTQKRKTCAVDHNIKIKLSCPTIQHITNSSFFQSFSFCLNRKLFVLIFSSFSTGDGFLLCAPKYILLVYSKAVGLIFYALKIYHTSKILISSIKYIIKILNTNIKKTLKEKYIHKNRKHY